MTRMDADLPSLDVGRWMFDVHFSTSAFRLPCHPPSSIFHLRFQILPPACRVNSSRRNQVKAEARRRRLPPQLAGGTRALRAQQFRDDNLDPFLVRQADVFGRHPAKTVNDVAALAGVPPAQRFGVHPNAIQGGQRLLDLDLCSASASAKGIWQLMRTFTVWFPASKDWVWKECGWLRPHWLQRGHPWSQRRSRPRWPHGPR